MGRRRAAPRETEQDEAVAPRVEQEEFQPLLSLTDFTKTVKNYPDTTGAVLYFYRLKPKINRKLVGIKFKYIERMTPPFPEDFIRYLRSTHGGGEYEIHMTDAKKVPAPVCRAQIIVPLEDCDPIIQNPAELVRGEAYTEQLIARWRAEGKVIVKEDGTLAAGQPGSTVTQQSDIANRLLDRLEKTEGQQNNAVVDVMAQGMGRVLQTSLEMMNPMKMLETMRDMAKGGGGDSQLMMVVLQQMMQQNTLLMQKIMERENPGGDPMRVMDRMLSMFDRLSERIEKGGKEDGWADTLVKIAPSVATMVGPWIESKAANHSGLVPDAQLPNGGKPAGSSIPATNEPPQEENMRRGVDALAHMILRCMDRNLNGSALATTIVTTQSTEAYYEWRSMGAEGLQKAFEHFAPERWKLMQQRPAEIKEFLGEFLTAFDEERETAHV
jgi:hypothetical protein